MAVAELSDANLLLCKCLDYYIIIGSFIVKLPQLSKIWKAKSGQGLAISAITIELFASCSKIAYSARNQFPFTSYGESVFLIFQNCAIGTLVLHFSSKRSILSVLYPMMTFVSIALLMSNSLTPMNLLILMQAGNVFVIIISKMIQAATNIRNKGTGQLSLTTISLLVSGQLARVYTSIQETGDTLIILRYLVSAMFNVVLLLQIYYYSRTWVSNGSTISTNSNTQCSAATISQKQGNGMTENGLLVTENGQSKGRVVINKHNYYNKPHGD